jgi:hypothetical protein
VVFENFDFCYFCGISQQIIVETHIIFLKFTYVFDITIWINTLSIEYYINMISLSIVELESGYRQMRKFIDYIVKTTLFLKYNKVVVSSENLPTTSHF